MRLVYMDEAGISRDEPRTVVSAILVHGDTQLNLIERQLLALVEKHIPEHQRQGFVFHATNLFNGVKGSDTVFGRDNPDWPIERRLEVADDLAAIFMDYDVPITWGVVNKATMAKLYPEFMSWPVEKAAVMTHQMAFLQCTMYVERWLREFGGDENCLLVVENNERHRSRLKALHRRLQTDKYSELFGDEWDHYFPFTRIREDPLFQEKRPNSILQLADFIAYVMKRRFNGDMRTSRFIDRFWQTVIFDRSLAEQAS